MLLPLPPAWPPVPACVTARLGDIQVTPGDGCEHRRAWGGDTHVLLSCSLLWSVHHGSKTPEHWSRQKFRRPRKAGKRKCSVNRCNVDESAKIFLSRHQRLLKAEWSPSLFRPPERTCSCVNCLFAGDYVGSAHAHQPDC